LVWAICRVRPVKKRMNAREIQEIHFIRIEKNKATPIANSAKARRIPRKNAAGTSTSQPNATK